MEPKLTGIFDSHAHYDDEAFDADRDEILERIRQSGVERLMNIGASLESSQSSIDLARRYDWIWAAVGIHPHDAAQLPDNWLEQLRTMADNPRVKAIGEIGYDYYYDGDYKQQQREVFEAQLQLANELTLPVIIHDRDAHQDTFGLLAKYRPKGVVHCYSGSAEMAKEILKLGMYIGFTGVVTFKNARRALEAVEVIPLNRLLVETDCPYMAPVPFRGKRCDSSMLPLTIAKLAEIKGVTPEQMAKQTALNAEQLFSLKQ
ncbi:MAG: TatD family hydrolase [Angelakisella sp.]|nr:TatD family hydrolase [Angelakisella sp.]